MGTPFKVIMGMIKIALGIAVLSVTIGASYAMESAPVVEYAAPAIEAPAVEVPEVEDVAPAVEVPAVEDAVQAVEVPAVEDAAPAVEVPAVEDAAPVVEASAVEDAAPAVEVPAVEDATPAVDVPAVEDAAPVVEIPVVEAPVVEVPAIPAVADVVPAEPTLFDTIMEWNDFVGGIVWGPWMCAFIVGVGIYLSVVLGFPQFRYFFISFKQVFGRSKSAKSEGSISSFAALATALAATVGTGNIAGVATALVLGGPGALFWMLFSALFGMTTKFTEVALAVKFREKDADGSWRGGTMYVLEHGIEQKWLGKLLAWLFAIFAFLASFGMDARFRPMQRRKA